MEIKGKVVAITEAKKVNDTLTTQTFVVEYDKSIGNDKTRAVKLAFDQRKTEKYDSIKKWDGVRVGDAVTVQFNEPESRDWNGKYFTSVEAWSVKKEGGNSASSSAASSASDDQSLPF